MNVRILPFLFLLALLITDDVNAKFRFRLSRGVRGFSSRSGSMSFGRGSSLRRYSTNSSSIRYGSPSDKYSTILGSHNLSQFICKIFAIL